MKIKPDKDAEADQSWRQPFAAIQQYSSAGGDVLDFDSMEYALEGYIATVSASMRQTNA